MYCQSNLHPPTFLYPQFFSYSFPLRKDTSLSVRKETEIDYFTYQIDSLRLNIVTPNLGSPLTKQKSITTHSEGVMHVLHKKSLS